MCGKNDNRKIGIVTLHNYNFGSALQCYASQLFLESLGYKVEVIDVCSKAGGIGSYAKTLWNLLKKCALNPTQCKYILRVFLSQRGRALTLSAISQVEIQKFNTNHLCWREYTEKELGAVSKQDEYVAFLSGSDQVWNGSRIDGYDKFFLRFAPREKRIAWAASFGGDTVAPYNVKCFSRYIKEFSHISVRELSGIGIVNSLTGCSATCLCDPIILLTAQQWREKMPTICCKNDAYILAFFIDKPSEKAIVDLQYLQNETGLPVYSFGYQHEELVGAEHYDGNPFDFLNFIDNAQYIFTDSFHAVAFSTLFHKNFWVYERMYTHSQNQSARLLEFLMKVNLQNRFEVKEIDTEMPCFHDADRYLGNAREEMQSYLDEIL